MLRKISKKLLVLVILFFSLMLVSGNTTPSTTYWTPAVMDIQPFGIFHIGIDNYFDTTRPSDSVGVSAFPTDVQVEVGIIPFDKVQMEVGIDALYAQQYPYYFNAKLGTPEDSFFKGQPGIDVGIFNVGTHAKVTPDSGRTDQDIMDVIVGKTLPFGLGRIHLALYQGNKEVLVASDGSVQNKGGMIAYDHSFCPVKDKDNNDYYKIEFAADWASGKNAIGGGGAGIYYFFTKDISLLVGPVWYNDIQINGSWKITTQLDINI